MGIAYLDLLFPSLKGFLHIYRLHPKKGRTFRVQVGPRDPRIQIGCRVDPSIQMIPTWGPKVCKYCLHWAIWVPRDSSSELKSKFSV